MNPVIKYTLLRYGLLLAVFLLLLPLPFFSVLVKAMLALLITMPLAWFLLRRWRDQSAEALAEGMARRRQRREQLRAALAGEDTPADLGSADPPAGSDSAEPR